MSKASTERDVCMNGLCYAADQGVFTPEEMNRMFARALSSLTTTEMNKMVAECTRFDDVDDVMFMGELK